MSGGAGANARGVQRLPLADGMQHVAYAIGASPAGRSGPAAAQRMGIHPLGNQRGQRAGVAVAWVLALWSFPKLSLNRQLLPFLLRRICTGF